MVQTYRMNLMDQIRSLSSQGYSRKQIMQTLGCSNSTLSKYIEAPITELGQKIIDLRDQGYSLKQIAIQLNIPKSTTSKWATRSKKHHLVTSQQQAKRIKIDKNEIKYYQQPGKTGRTNYNLKELTTKRKSWLVEQAGGKCQNCQFNQYLPALSFHHLDPQVKSFNICEALKTCSIQRIISEVEKCCLLCLNCHAAVEAGLITQAFEPITMANIEIPDNLFYQDELLKLDEETFQAEVDWITKQKASVKPTIEQSITEIDPNSISITTLDRLTLNDFCDQHHYLRASKKGHIASLGFFSGKSLVGIALLTNPVRQYSAIQNCIEISRFSLNNHSKNLGSKCLSLVVRYVKLNLERFDNLVAFADTSKHAGTIYTAANFKRIGGKFKTYHYDGIHKKTIYERAKKLGLSESAYARVFQLAKIAEAGKQKFIYELH